MSETVEEGGLRITTTGEAPKSTVVATGITPEVVENKSDLSKAASELGKASAEKRYGKAQNSPEATIATTDALEVAEETEASPAGTEKLGKPRHDPKARMLEATREAAELKRERETLRAEKEQLQRDLAEARKAREAGEAPPKEERSFDGTKKPEPDDFPNWTDYLDARDVWNDTQREARMASQRKDEQFHAGVNEALSTFTKRMTEAAAADPTLPERTSALQALRPSFVLSKGEKVGPENVIADEIINSEQAPALMLYLAEHDDEFQRIATLRTPFEIQMAMAKLEGRLGAAPTATVAKPVSQSQASDPIRPVTGPAHLADKVPNADAPYEEHKRYWSRRDRERSASR